MTGNAAFKAFAAFRRGAGALLLAALTMEACAYYEAQERPVTQVLAASHPSTIRVTTTAGQVWLLDRPRVSRDTLLGSDGGAAVVIPVGEVTRVDIERLSPVRTIFLGFGTVLIAGAVDFICCTKFYVFGKPK